MKMMSTLCVDMTNALCLTLMSTLCFSCMFKLDERFSSQSTLCLSAAYIMFQSDEAGLFGIPGGASDGAVVVTGELDYDTGPIVHILNVSVRVRILYWILYRILYTGTM